MDAYEWIILEFQKNKLTLIHSNLGLNADGSMKDGEYTYPSTEINIDIGYLNSEWDICLILHELGHYYDCKEKPDLKIPISEREYQADKYMVDNAKKFDLEKKAKEIAEMHKRTFGYPNIL
jgi:hypothetical protein